MAQPALDDDRCADVHEAGQDLLDRALSHEDLRLPGAFPTAKPPMIMPHGERRLKWGRLERFPASRGSRSQHFTIVRRFSLTEVVERRYSLIKIDRDRVTLGTPPRPGIRGADGGSQIGRFGLNASAR